MTPEAQRIAIAEACGWKWQEGTEPTYGGTNIPRGWINPKTSFCVIELPDYLKDLNAMHKAEKTFNNGLSVASKNSPWWKYQLELSSVTKASYEDKGPIAIICATAAQRAEAFLKAIGKWVD